MRDHEAKPDPVDKAYAQAEALLSDAAARAARRARVLAAVAREAGVSPPARRAPWRGGGWLVAAGVAGLSAYLATQIYSPVPVLQPPRPAADAAASPGTAAARPPDAARPGRNEAPLPESASRAPTGAAAPPGASGAAPPLTAPRAAPPPDAAPAAHASLEDVLVTAQRREEPMTSREARQSPQADRVEEVVVTSSRSREPDVAAPGSSSTPKSAASSDRAARLRSAAAAGRVGELAALLADGAPVDATDAEGETALMKAIQHGQRAAAALLRRRGASLDRRNHAGDSARDMAAAMDDPELDRSLGLEP